MEPYVPTEQERRVVAMLSQEPPPLYNAANERMIVLPGTVQQPLARDFESLDPRLAGKSATVSACQQLQYLLRSDRYKVSALRYVTHLSAEPQNQQYLPLTPLMADLVECMREKNSLDELELTCWVIANLSALEQNRDVLRQAKVLPALVHLLNHYSERVHVRAMAAATNLLQNPKNKLLFRELSGVSALADRLANGSDKTKDAALRAICIQGFDKGSLWQLLQADVITGMRERESVCV
jgi:Armadillo/beta-catenin-like repeat